MGTSAEDTTPLSLRKTQTCLQVFIWLTWVHFSIELSQDSWHKEVISKITMVPVEYQFMERPSMMRTSTSNTLDQCSFHQPTLEKTPMARWTSRRFRRSCFWKGNRHENSKAWNTFRYTICQDRSYRIRSRWRRRRKEEEVSNINIEL